MITTIAATQLVFLSLGILALNVLLKAGGYAPNVAHNFPDLTVQLARNGLIAFLVPLAWIALAALCDKTKHPAIARVTGILIAIAIFAVYTYAASLCF